MRFIKFLAFILSVQISVAFASYPQISSLHELEEALSKADEKTLIVFDVDEVLITTKDHFLHPYALDDFFLWAQRAFENAKSEEEKIDVEEKLSLCMLLPERVLIEENAPKLIEKLQKKKAKVIALTSCRTGTFGVIPKVEKWRFEHLQSLGVDFSSAFSHIPRHEFHAMASSGKRAPLFENGILFSKGYEKGDLLLAFLKVSDFKPTQVIFIDDLTENIESVEKALQSLNIPCKSYHYLGAKRFFKKPDAQILRAQFEHLMRHREWLSDEEIKERLYFKEAS